MVRSLSLSLTLAFSLSLFVDCEGMEEVKQGFKQEATQEVQLVEAVCVYSMYVYIYTYIYTKDVMEEKKLERKERRGYKGNEELEERGRE